MVGKIKYRPDIDGLRAIAVLSVIVYHAKISLNNSYILNGGFLGVDIFFVISGYLISSIIFKEIKEKKNFSFLNFYERRVRRIFPVLFVVLLFTFFLGFLFLEPIFFVNLSNSIISSLLFFSNIFFYITGIEYDAPSSLNIPLLHTWSLSIEEQFYIIFPILLLTINNLQKNKYFIIISIIIISILSAEVVGRYNQDLNFYILSSRVWELMCGVLCALIKINGYKEKISKKNYEIIHIIAFILIFSSLLLFSDQNRNPSLITLIPILGTMLIILFDKNDTFISKFLTLKILVFIGLISYSLYLWHYPFFAFSRIIFENNHPNINLIKFAIPVIIIIFSILTYFFIEKPFRNKNFIPKKKFFLVITLFFIFILILNLTAIKNNGFTNRLPKILHQNLGLHDRGKLIDENGICDERLNNFCDFGKINNPRIILLGDSQMAAIEYQLKKKALKNNFSFSSITKMSCIYMPNFNRLDTKTNSTDSECSSSTQKIRKNFLEKNENSIIILGGRYTMYLSGSKFDNKEGGIESTLPWSWRFVHKDKEFSPEEGIKNSILELAKKNKVIILYPIPEVGWHVPQKIFLNSRLNYLKFWQNKSDEELTRTEKITTSFKVYLERNKRVFDLFDDISGKNIYRIYPHQIFCNRSDNRCLTHDKNNVYYYDYNHLSSHGSKLLSDQIIKKIKKIFE